MPTIVGCCEACSKGFQRDYRTQRPKYCQPCSDRLQHKAQRFCKDCGVSVGKGKHRCEGCAAAKERLRHAADPRPCATCAAVFVPSVGRTNVPYCYSCQPLGARVRDPAKLAARRIKERDQRRDKNGWLSRAEKEERKNVTAAIRRLEGLARKLARQAARPALIAAKPWLAPGLSIGEKYRLRRLYNPAFCVSERIRIQMRKRKRYSNMEHAIRKAVAGKVTTPSIERFLGYKMTDLRAHLEAQFTDGMDWAAFCEGRIHIDHRRPVALFDLEDTEQVRACWGMDNLQPLWARDNMTKGAKYDGAQA